MLSTALRLLVTAAYRAHRWAQQFTGRPPGVHSVVLTPTGEVVLVRLRYAPGWQLPGGGRKPTEIAEEGLRRELREEIGLYAWTALERVESWPEAHGTASGDALFVIRGARYRPHWSLEIAEVRAFAHDDLPAHMTGWAMRALRYAE